MTKAEWRITFENWMVNDGPKVIFFIVWCAINVFLFFYSYEEYLKAANYSDVRAVLLLSLPVARGSASVLNFNSAIIMFTVCRNIITLLRSTFIGNFVPLDKNITFHKILGWTIAFFVFIHVGSHFFNFLHLETASASSKSAAGYPVSLTAYEAGILTIPGTTGLVLNLVMMIMYSSALGPMRMKYFEAFWYSHQLFLLYYALLFYHGAACLVHPNVPDATCIPGSWKWCVGTLFLYLIERLVREIRGRRETYISKVVQHPSKVFEIQIKKPSMSYKPGHYLFLNCPDVAFFQWHPITISSAPEEEFIGLHIRVVGDWTIDVAKRLGCKFDDKEDPQAPSSLPRILIDGPYGTASSDVFKFEVAVLVGAGIGVTPFSSILKSIWYKVINPQTVMKMRKCYFYWVCRDTQAFEWFQDLLEALEAEDVNNFLEIHMFLTGGLKADEVRNVVMSGADGRDAVTGLKSPTHFGRPDFDNIFKKMAEDHPGIDVGIFFCGPKPLSRTLHKAANRNTSSKDGGTRFYYHKENF